MSRNPSVSLTKHQQDFVEKLVSSGRYHGTSEVLRAGLRLLEDDEERRATALKELRSGVADGLNDIANGRVQDFDPERIIAKAETRQSGR